MLRRWGLWSYIDDTEGTITGSSDSSDLKNRHQEIYFLILKNEDEIIAPVIGLRDKKIVWETLREIYKEIYEVRVDEYFVKYQSFRMQLIEKMTKYVN